MHMYFNSNVVYNMETRSCSIYCVGTTVIAGLQIGRNVLCVEKAGMNFIHQKTRAINLLSTSKANTETAESGEIEAIENEEIER